MRKSIVFMLLLLSCLGLFATQPADYLTFKGEESKPGQNKHVVLIAGDEEYRSEESLPMLAQILSTHHGFKTTVLFSMDSNNQFIDPYNRGSMSNPEALDSADAIIMAIRWRNYGEKVMSHFAKAFERGVPILALRTSTHPFKGTTGIYTKYGHGKGHEGGWDHCFGRHVIGERWVNHHGKHAVEGTRSFVEEAQKLHPVLNSVGTIFGKTDVYGASPKEPSTVLLRGAVTESLDPASKVLTGKKNAPMMPIAWTREFKHENGTINKIFTTTMGSADDLQDESLRRLVVNAVYYGFGLRVPAKANVTYIKNFKPTMYGFRDEKDGIRKGFIRGKTPSDYIDWISPKHKGK